MKNIKRSDASFLKRLKRLLVRNVFYLIRSIDPWRLVDLSMARCLDVIVISPGGAGTTMLIGELNKYCKVNCISDTDYLKHLPYNRVRSEQLLTGTKIIYLHDDPSRVRASIERRGWLRVQGSKLGSTRCVLLPEGFQKSHFERRVVCQIAGFVSHKHRNLMVTSFNDLWNDLDCIAEFVGLQDTDFVQNFPDRRVRQS